MHVDGTTILCIAAAILLVFLILYREINKEKFCGIYGQNQACLDRCKTVYQENLAEAEDYCRKEHPNDLEAVASCFMNSNALKGAKACQDIC